MSLPEKLYGLRRTHGLSQEALAEKLNCSRQVISKWENGTTTPDVETLQKYSELFGVSIDSLVKDEAEDMQDVPPSVPSPKKNKKDDGKLLGILGLVVSLLGCVSLIVFGVILIFYEKTASGVAQSSTIVLDGTSIAMLISVLFVIFGVILLIKTGKRK